MPAGPWDDSAERRLLLSVLDPDVKPKWDIVAGRMGEGFTGEACRQRFYKLKRECEQLKSGGEMSAPATPKTPKPPKTPKTPGTGRGRKRKEASEEQGSAKRAKKAAAEEPEDENEGDEEIKSELKEVETEEAEE